MATTFEPKQPKDPVPRKADSSVKPPHESNPVLPRRGIALFDTISLTQEPLWPKVKYELGITNT